MCRDRYGLLTSAAAVQFSACTSFVLSHIFVTKWQHFVTKMTHFVTYRVTNVTVYNCVYVQWQVEWINARRIILNPYSTGKGWKVFLFCCCFVFSWKWKKKADGGRKEGLNFVRFSRNFVFLKGIIMEQKRLRSTEF